MEGEKKDREDNLPPGFRFHPTDEELITHYLINKLSDSKFTSRAIGDVDLNKCEPWDLPGKAKMGVKEWYFFSLRDRKYPTGVRTNRATSTGYWKTTGKDREIYDSTTMELIGMKKTLVFYRGRAPRGEKSNWVMHEYRMHSKSAYRCAKDEWVVCRVFQKTMGLKKYPTSQASRTISLEMGSSLLPPPTFSIDPAQFPNMARNYMFGNMDLAAAESFSRGLRTAAGSSSSPNMAFQPHLNYPMGGPAGCFAIPAGLNLNLGGVGASNATVSHQGMSSTMLAASTLGMENGFVGVDANSAAGSSNRFASNVDNCAEFDNYWPNYN